MHVSHALFPVVYSNCSVKYAPVRVPCNSRNKLFLFYSQSDCNKKGQSLAVRSSVSTATVTDITPLVIRNAPEVY